MKPWQFEGASCWGINTDLFFPEGVGISMENKQAMKICGNCIWQKECLTYSLHYKVDGIWAGTSNIQRKRLRKQLNIIAKPITNERYVA